ncbi:RNA-directed DNA polymerase, eukaryota [Tanacetum coccineum]
METLGWPVSSQKGDATLGIRKWIYKFTNQDRAHRIDRRKKFKFSASPLMIGLITRMGMESASGFTSSRIRTVLIGSTEERSLRIRKWIYKFTNQDRAHRIDRRKKFKFSASPLMIGLITRMGMIEKWMENFVEADSQRGRSIKATIFSVYVLVVNEDMEVSKGDGIFVDTTMKEELVKRKEEAVKRNEEPLKQSTECIRRNQEPIHINVTEEHKLPIFGMHNELYGVVILISRNKKTVNRAYSGVLSVGVVRESDTDILKEELRLCDELIDKGMGSSEVVQNRLEILNKIHQVQKNQASEISQKAKIKWAIEGDENVKFFHGILNKKRSQSQIRGVMANGVWIDDPVKVKDEFLMHFRSRFDKPLLNRALLDLNFTNSLTNEQKEDLEQDITKEEVKRAVWDCGVDKSPGPDGFSFYFYRHFWSMIEDDVFGAVEYFFINGDIPNGCNSNFIALIPKIIDANMVKDFRPISLIGSLYKIIAKLLANRLVGVLSNLINEVQSAFVADRQILDGPFILNEVLQWCRKKRKHALIFKVDFEKAYDSVRWDFLDDVLDKFGFGVKWRNWIQSCLRSSRGSILINGSPTKEFQFFRGLKQGDPLSPFLFILVMESLHISFQRVVDAGLFNGINLSSTVNLSHLFYADDAIFIGQWNELNIDTLVRVLECFFRASGLRINMSKSKIMGVNVEDAKVKIAANKLGCLVLKTPFTYLGTKVGENMHRKHAWNEVVEKVLSRLSRWKLKTLSIGGRFTLLKSVLGSMPIFHMSIFKVPSSILNSLEVIRSRFFNGHEHKSNKATWFKWNKVLTSKEKGGLGVSSLFALNRGLLFKWLWRFYSQKDSLWTKVIKALYGEDGSLDKVGASAARTCWTTIVQEVKVIQAQGINIHDFIKLKLGNGEDSRFWLDKWYEGGVLKRLFPRVYALELDKNISVSSKLKAPSLVTTFRRNARSGIEQTQFDSMAEIMKTISLVPRVDRYIWSLENDGSFSVASIRKTLDDNRFQEESLSTRWVKSVPIKVNILAWKVKSNALPTRFNISRRGMDIDSIDCPICKMGVETTSHVFFQCNVVRQVMRKISSWWNVEYMEVNSYEEWRSWLVSTRIRSNIKVIIEGIYYGLCNLPRLLALLKSVWKLIFNLIRQTMETLGRPVSSQKGDAASGELEVCDYCQ